jgi:assimilatory nitrate reductase catalytic subunit
MSSTAAAGIRTLGVDRGLPFPLDDILQAEVVLLGGGNLAETMPLIMPYFQRQHDNGGEIILAGPSAGSGYLFS